MSLLKTIHDRWTTGPLNDLLPSDRLFTGISTDPKSPYAVLRKTGVRTLARHNQGIALEMVSLRLDVYHQQHAPAAAIVERVRAEFDGASFTLDSGDRVVAINRHSECEQQEADSLWHLTIELDCSIARTPCLNPP